MLRRTQVVSLVGSLSVVAAIHGCSSSPPPDSTGFGGSSGTPSSSGSNGSSGATSSGSSSASTSGSSGGISSGASSSGGVRMGGSSNGSSGGGSGSSGGVGSSGSSGSGTHVDGGSSSSGSSSGADASTDSGPVTYPPLTSSDVSNAVATQVSSQFYFTEGPVWDPKANVLYLTDMGVPNGGAVMRLTPPSTVDMLLQPSGSADGIGLDNNNNVIAAGYPSRNAWRLTSGMMATMSACSGSSGPTCYMGQTINTPDDITARADGVIYFTDPTFAQTMGGIAPVASGAFSSPQAVYRITTDGVLHQEDTMGNGPNGVNLSPDQKSLYVSYTLDSNVYKFTVAADGSLSNKTLFASGLTLADSMCVDAGGNLYVGTSGGLAVLDPSGNALGTISAGGTTTNCAFGGPDQKTLYITSHGFSAPAMGQGFLYKVDNWPVPGIPGQN